VAEEVSDWFSYLDHKTAPRPSHKRLPPSKAGRPGATPSVTGSGAVRLSVRDVVFPPEPKPDPIEVTESEASDSMILRAFKFWQR
jgi:hypothetical protein